MNQCCEVKPVHIWIFGTCSFSSCTKRNSTFLIVYLILCGQFKNALTLKSMNDILIFNTSDFGQFEKIKEKNKYFILFWFMALDVTGRSISGSLSSTNSFSFSNASRIL